MLLQGRQVRKMVSSYVGENREFARQILAGEPRIDGRDTRTVRPISIRTGVLPRTHGSALFTRGETQALVVATLGTKGDEHPLCSGFHEPRKGWPGGQPRTRGSALLRMAGLLRFELRSHPSEG